MCSTFFLRAQEHINVMEYALSQNVLLPLLMVHLVTRMYYYYYYYSVTGALKMKDKQLTPNLQTYRDVSHMIIVNIVYKIFSRHKLRYSLFKPWMLMAIAEQGLTFKGYI